MLVPQTAVGVIRGYSRIQRGRYEFHISTYPTKDLERDSSKWTPGEEDRAWGRAHSELEQGGHFQQDPCILPLRHCRNTQMKLHQLPKWLHRPSSCRRPTWKWQQDKQGNDPDYGVSSSHHASIQYDVICVALLRKEHSSMFSNAQNCRTQWKRGVQRYEWPSTVGDQRPVGRTHGLRSIIGRQGRQYKTVGTSCLIHLQHLLDEEDIK